MPVPPHDSSTTAWPQAPTAPPGGESLPRCPACAAALTGEPRCRSCGLLLVGPTAGRLWEVDQQLDRLRRLIDDLGRRLTGARRDTDLLTAERGRLLAQLRASTSTVTPVAPPTLRPVQQPARSGRPKTRTREARSNTVLEAGSNTVPEAGSNTVPEARSHTVQQVLLVTGGVLLAVAAIVFLFVSWRVLGLAGRAAVLATLTGLALWVGRPLRSRGLGSTAEALTGVGVVMLLLDVVAARRTGFAGLDEPTLPHLVAAAATGCAAVLAAHARWVRTRASGIAALMLVQAPGVALATSFASVPAQVTALAATAVVDLVLAARLPRLGLHRSATAALALALPAWLAACWWSTALGTTGAIAVAALALAAVPALAAALPVARPVVGVPAVLTVLSLLVSATAGASALGAGPGVDGVLGCAAVAALLAVVTRAVPPVWHRVLRPAAGALLVVAAGVWSVSAAWLVLAAAGAAGWASGVWAHPLAGTLAATGDHPVTTAVLVSATVPLVALGTVQLLPRRLVLTGVALGVATPALLAVLALDLPLAVTLALMLAVAAGLAAQGRRSGSPALALAALATGLAAVGWSLGSETATPFTLAALLVGLLVTTGVPAWRTAVAGLAVPAGAALVLVLGLRAGLMMQTSWDLTAGVLVLPLVGLLLAGALTAGSLTGRGRAAGAPDLRRTHDAVEAATGAVAVLALACTISSQQLGVRLLLVLSLLAATTVRPVRREVRVPVGTVAGVAVGAVVPWLLGAAPATAAGVQLAVALLAFSGAAVAAVLAAAALAANESPATTTPTDLAPSAGAAPTTGIAATTRSAALAAVRTRDALAVAAGGAVLAALASAPPAGVVLAVLGIAAVLLAGCAAVPSRWLPGRRRTVATLLAATCGLACTAPLSQLVGWTPAQGGLALAVGAALAAGFSALVHARADDRAADRTVLEVVAAIAGLLAVAPVAGTAPTLSWGLAALGLGALAVGVAPDRRRIAVVGALLLSAAGWVRLAAADIDAPELYAAPVGLLALYLGHLRRRRSGASCGASDASCWAAGAPEAPSSTDGAAGTSSWAAYGCGLGILLVPSLFASLTRPGDLRPALLATIASVVVLAGARWRLQAPLVIGAVVLMTDALVRTAPWAATVPVWMWAGLVGAVLLGLGAGYERRLGDARRLHQAWQAWS